MTTRDSSSLALAQSGFAQQGTVDWVDLASTLVLKSKSANAQLLSQYPILEIQHLVSFFVGILSRLSAAGVDPYTLIVGQALAQNLHIPIAGNKSIERALKELKCYAGVQNAFWFGFGIKNIVRELGTTDQGCSCLALCAALSECFSDEFAADVLHELTLAQKAPEQLTPSIGQWHMLVQACSGVFATSKFPLLVEGFESLLRTDDRVGGIPPRPADFASALIGIGKVSYGQLAQINITQRKLRTAGGWLAAVSEWFLGLKVAIYNQGDQLLYSNCLSTSDAQIQIRSETQAAHADGSLVRLEETLFLKGVEEIFRLSADALKCDIGASGRVPWESCLSVTFGKLALH